MLSRLDLRQLWYLSQSGMVRLSFRLPEIKKTKTVKRQRTKTRLEKKWKSFRERFGWVDELLKEGEDEGGTN